jgi:hypothetical protein
MNAIRKMGLAAGLVAALGAAGGAHAALVITTSTDPTALASALIGSGGGITIVGTPTLTGAATQQGTFTGGVSAGVGIDTGVILTSGDAQLAPGPNTSDGAGPGLGTAGNAQLDALLPAGQTTNDANVLQFNFTTTTGNLFFRYVFASDEYNEFVGSEFNDVFGFFLNGTNIALIPGTSTPVAINNVNCGDPYTPPAGGTNCSLFNNNDLDDGGPFFNLQYDGFTDVFTASITGLALGVAHTMTLAIADTGDTILDSAVFLEAGSFQAEPPPTNGVPEPGSLALVGLGLLGVILASRRKG